MHPNHTTNEILYGYCQCGCGQKTRIARQSHTKLGWTKGEPIKYIRGHACKGRVTFQTLAEHFWKYCPKSTPAACWEWTGAKSSNGYGAFNHHKDAVNGKTRYAAHRVSWEIHYGPIPDDLRVLHKCDNPPCCNPEHLFLGTESDNRQDMWDKGRRPRRWKQRK